MRLKPTFPTEPWSRRVPGEPAGFDRDVFDGKALQRATMLVEQHPKRPGIVVYSIEVVWCTLGVTFLGPCPLLYGSGGRNTTRLIKARHGLDGY